MTRLAGRRGRVSAIRASWARHSEAVRRQNQIDGGASEAYDEPFELGEGVHGLAFWSTDAAGNVEEERTATVSVDLSDPELDVTSPADGSSTSETTTTVTGTASDSLSGVEQVTVDGQEAQLDGGPDEFAFELAGVDLACGPNTLTVVATNGAGRTDSDEVSVTRQCASVTGIDNPLKTSQQGDVNINDIRGNRVLPIKVELEYLDEAYVGSDAGLGNPAIRLRELPDCDDKDGLEVADVDAAGRANTDDEFRWSDGKWIYNLSSSGLEGGTCYRVDVLLDGARASNGRWAVVRTK